MRSWRGVRESRGGKGQRGAELPRGSWARCSSSSGGAGSGTVSNKYGYREGHTSPSSFLTTTVCPKISQKYGTICYHLLGFPLCSPRLRGCDHKAAIPGSPVQQPGKRMEGSQAKETGVWLKAPPSPWAGQGRRGLVGHLVLSNRNRPTLALGHEELQFSNLNLRLSV